LTIIHSTDFPILEFGEQNEAGMAVVEQYIESFDGTRLFTSTSGEGPIPVVLCDGLGCDGFIWQHLRPVFEDRCTFYHFHYRGHGLSALPAVANALTVRDLRSDLKAVMDHYCLDRAVLMGHSMGVQVILDMAIHHPERILGLVPSCGSFGHPLDTFHNTDLMGRVLPYLRKMLKISQRVAQKFWSKSLTTEIAYQFAVNLEVNGKVLRREEFAPYFRHLAMMDVGVFLGIVEGMSDHSCEPFLDCIKVPTLVVAGQYDTFTPAFLSEKMVRLIPNSELLMIPGGTHVAPIEIPELLHLRLRDFLDTKIAPLIALKKKATKPRSNGATKKKTVKKKAPARKKVATVKAPGQEVQA